MNKVRKIAVVTHFYGWGERVLSGISEYVRQNPRWVLHLIPSDSVSLREDLRDWQPDGIISSVLDKDIPVANPGYRWPWVSILSEHETIVRAYVTVDEDAVGRMAADFFMDRKLRSFGFIGNSEHAFSRNRAEGFRYALAAHGFDCSVFLYRTKISTQTKKQRMTVGKQKLQWLKGLHRTAGVLACDDWEAFQFVQFCRLHGVRVPEDVAVLGVGNDEPFVSVSTPPLSSIRIPFDRVGYEAASMLDRILDEKPLEKDKVYLQPIGMVSRQSTDIFNVMDPVLAKALRFIQEHISEPIKVQDLLEHVFVSRTLLESKFRAELDRTPLMEIRRQRIQHAKQMLVDTDRSIQEIANACGFGSDIRLSTVFRELVDTTPTAYRKRFRVPTHY